MSSFKKKIFDISTIGITEILGIGTAAIFWFYIASTLGPESYGEITFLTSIAALVTGITIFGSNTTLMVFPAKKIDIQSTLYLIILVANLIAGIIIFILFLNASLSFLIFAYTSFALVSSTLLGKKLYKEYSKYVITQKILLVIFGISFYYLIGVEGILIGIALSHVHFGIRIFKGLKESKINFKIIKEKKKFILNNFALSISSSFNASLDKLIIAPFLGFAVLGNYSLGLQFFAILMLLPATSMKYLVTQQSSGIDNSKIKKILILISVIIAILGSIIAPMVIGAIFPKFLDAQEIIRIVSWTIIPMTINASIYFPKFLAEEKNHKLLFTSMTIVFTQIIGILSLGSMYGANGIAIAFLISSCCGTVCATILNKYGK